MKFKWENGMPGAPAPGSVNQSQEVFLTLEVGERLIWWHDLLFVIVPRGGPYDSR